MNATIGYRLQATATPWFHWLYDRWYQTIWLIPGAPEDPVDETVVAEHGAEALYSAVKSLMHAIRTEEEEAQLDAVHWMIQIAKSWTIRWWLESKFANGKPPVRIPTENIHRIDLKWTDEE